MDNDGLHKLTYRLREFFADLLCLVAPALAAELDFDRVEDTADCLRRAGREAASGSARATWRGACRGAGTAGTAGTIGRGT